MGLIVVQGAKLLAKGIENSATLTSLDLGDNSIADEGV